MSSVAGVVQKHFVRRKHACLYGVSIAIRKWITSKRENRNSVRAWEEKEIKDYGINNSSVGTCGGKLQEGAQFGGHTTPGVYYVATRM